MAPSISLEESPVSKYRPCEDMRNCMLSKPQRVAGIHHVVTLGGCATCLASPGTPGHSGAVHCRGNECAARRAIGEADVISFQFTSVRAKQPPRRYPGCAQRYPARRPAASTVSLQWNSFRHWFLSLSAHPLRRATSFTNRVLLG